MARRRAECCVYRTFFTRLRKWTRRVWRVMVGDWWEMRPAGKINLSPGMQRLLSPSWWLPVGNENSYQIFWVFRRWKSRFFFLMGNLLFLKCHVGQTKHDCGPHSACGLPFWDLWFIVLAEHDVSVPICNPEACSFQTQFAFSVLRLPPSLFYYWHTCLMPPPRWYILWMARLAFFSVCYLLCGFLLNCK